MKNILFIALTLCISCALANKAIPKPVIPLFVADLDTYRVRDEIIRVVTAYETHSPMIYIERIKTPDFKLLEQLTINSLTLINGQTLTFKNISGVFIERIEMDDTTLSILYDYIPAKGSGFLVDCTIFIGEKKFDPMQCSRQKRPHNS